MYRYGAARGLDRAFTSLPQVSVASVQIVLWVLVAICLSGLHTAMVGSLPPLADEGDIFDSLLTAERASVLLEEACGLGQRPLPVAARLDAALQLAELARSGLDEEEGTCCVTELLAAAELAAPSSPQLAAALLAAADVCGRLVPRPVYTCATSGARLRDAGRAALGLQVWQAAPLLVQRLAALPHLLAGKRVLELGSGCGLVGLAAARLGASSVVLSDTPSATGVLELLRENAQLNEGEGCPVTVLALDWGDDVGSEPLPRFDVLLGSDVLYHAHHAPLLARTIAARLCCDADAFALLMCPLRNASLLPAVVAAAEPLGLRVEAQMEPGAAEEKGIACIQLKWAA
jgi:predicted nicotinamide N-methyase